MIAGRSGSQKSGFALWLVANWNLPTLYMSGDMTAFQASTRLAAMRTSRTTEQVEAEMAAGGERKRAILDSLRDLRMTFSFGAPITWRGIEDDLTAYVEVWDEYPKVIVVDNLMDVEDCDSDYSAQMNAMSELVALSRNTGATVMILHHATDKSNAAAYDPSSPPSRSEVKGGLSEKPELSLSVAINPVNSIFRVAVIKQRMGPSDPSAQSYAELQARPEHTQFFSYRIDPNLKHY